LLIALFAMSGIPPQGGWPSLPLAQPHSGCPILRGFLRRVGSSLFAKWDPPFTLRGVGTKFVPNPHSPAPAQLRREDRSDNCSSANPRAPPPGLRFTGFRCIYLSFSTRFFSVRTLKS